MMILQFQFTNLQEDEKEIIPDFCEFLKSLMLAKLNTKINRKKISLRLKYIEEEAKWINWDNNRKYNTSVQDIIETIMKAIIAVPYKNNLWKIEVDANVLIPDSYTSIDRLIRFLNYGDIKCKATGMFTNLEHEYKHQKLNAMWNYYIMRELGHNAVSNIITI